MLDVLVNNSDRKGDHILAMAYGHRYGVDHGLTLHMGWIGEAVSADRGGPSTSESARMSIKNAADRWTEAATKDGHA